MGKSIQSGMSCSQGNGFRVRIPEYTRPSISGDLVSIKLHFINTFSFLTIVECPDLQPRRDYDDYTKFINDTFHEEKEDMLNKTISTLSRAGKFASKIDKYDSPLNTLRQYGDRGRNFGNYSTMSRHRPLNTVNASPTENKMGTTFTEFNVKPRILESKIST